MKTRSRKTIRRFQLKLLNYGNHYYIERITDLEKALARRPRQLQIDLVGVGEMPADMALLIRSVLQNRSTRTRIITNARSSLQAGAVLVWLMGDQRLIRPDADVHFRRLDLPDAQPFEQWEAKSGGESSYRDSYSQIEPEEGNYARVLGFINEFLPVQELSGQLVNVSILQQFGLVDSDHFDRFLAGAFGGTHEKHSTGPPGKKKGKTKPQAKLVRSARQN